MTERYKALKLRQLHCHACAKGLRCASTAGFHWGPLIGKIQEERPSGRMFPCMCARCTCIYHLCAQLHMCPCVYDAVTTWRALLFRFFPLKRGLFESPRTSPWVHICIVKEATQVLSNCAGPDYVIALPLTAYTCILANFHIYSQANLKVHKPCWVWFYNCSLPSNIS